MHEGRQAAVQIAQKACAISVLGGIQDTTGLRPKQPGLTLQLILLQEQQDRLKTSQGPFQLELSYPYPGILEMACVKSFS